MTGLNMLGLVVDNGVQVVLQLMFADNPKRTSCRVGLFGRNTSAFGMVFNRVGAES